MSGFQVGDVVVRVKANCPDPLPEHLRCNRVSNDGIPPVGSVHRVSDVVFTRYEEGVCVPGYRSKHPTGAWNSLNFRKIDRADDSFTASIRACKPHRVGEPA